MGGFRLRGRCCLGEVKGMKLHSGMMGAWVGPIGVGGKAYWSGLRVSPRCRVYVSLTMDACGRE